MERGLQSHSHLPRLSREHYQNTAFVHWVYGIDNRATGWLDETFYATFRELLIHTLARYNLVCPAYCLMPDHIHLVWCGTAEQSDQQRASSFIRRQLTPHLKPHHFQKQPFDHVLRDSDREHGAFATLCQYVFENPVRKGLCEKWMDYRFSGCTVPGYPDLDIRSENYWELFWRIYARIRELSGTA